MSTVMYSELQILLTNIRNKTAVLKSLDLILKQIVKMLNVRNNNYKEFQDQCSFLMFCLSGFKASHITDDVAECNIYNSMTDLLDTVIGDENTKLTQSFQYNSVASCILNNTNFQHGFQGGKKSGPQQSAKWNKVKTLLINCVKKSFENEQLTKKIECYTIELNELKKAILLAKEDKIRKIRLEREQLEKLQADLSSNASEYVINDDMIVVNTDLSCYEHQICSTPDQSHSECILSKQNSDSLEQVNHYHDNITVDNKIDTVLSLEDHTPANIENKSAMGKVLFQNIKTERRNPLMTLFNGNSVKLRARKIVNSSNNGDGIPNKRVRIIEHPAYFTTNAQSNNVIEDAIEETCSSNEVLQSVDCDTLRSVEPDATAEKGANEDYSTDILINTSKPYHFENAHTSDVNDDSTSNKPSSKMLSILINSSGFVSQLPLKDSLMKNQFDQHTESTLPDNDKSRRSQISLSSENIHDETRNLNITSQMLDSTETVTESSVLSSNVVDNHSLKSAPALKIKNYIFSMATKSVGRDLGLNPSDRSLRFVKSTNIHSDKEKAQFCRIDYKTDLLHLPSNSDQPSQIKETHLSDSLSSLSHEPLPEIVATVKQQSCCDSSPALILSSSIHGRDLHQQPDSKGDSNVNKKISNAFKNLPDHKTKSNILLSLLQSVRQNVSKPKCQIRLNNESLKYSELSKSKQEENKQIITENYQKDSFIVPLVHHTNILSDLATYQSLSNTPDIKEPPVIKTVTSKTQFSHCGTPVEEQLCSLTSIPDSLATYNNLNNETEIVNGMQINEFCANPFANTSNNEEDDCDNLLGLFGSQDDDDESRNQLNVKFDLSGKI
ncbi:hypothetical protein GJ496_005863 [Pomphorhynchus laevis]|nr:hypothetical protein GJ496_005863 [Pomphorhynchus laevis]